MKRQNISSKMPLAALHAINETGERMWPIDQKLLLQQELLRRARQEGQQLPNPDPSVTVTAAAALRLQRQLDLNSQLRTLLGTQPQLQAPHASAMNLASASITQTSPQLPVPSSAGHNSNVSFPSAALPSQVSSLLHQRQSHSPQLGSLSGHQQQLFQPNGLDSSAHLHSDVLRLLHQEESIQRQRRFQELHLELQRQQHQAGVSQQEQQQGTLASLGSGAAMNPSCGVAGAVTNQKVAGVSPSANGSVGKVVSEGASASSLTEVGSASASLAEATASQADLEADAATTEPQLSGKTKKKPAPASSAAKASNNKKPPTKKNTKWLASFEELRKYKEVHGDCIVPRGYAENPKLGSWVAEQRKQYKLMQDSKQSSITPERIALLSALDFSWNAQEAAWARHMRDLRAFRKETGNCHVPLNHHKWPKLGLWVKEQRRHYTLLKQGKQSHMTPERAKELDSVGFCWDTHEATWLDRLGELKAFREKYGSCVVPTNFKEHPKLGTWVHHQRRQYKKFKEGKPCHITVERIRALENLGFVWYPRGDRLSQNSSGSNGEDDSSGGSDSETDVSSLDLRPPKRQRRV